MENFAKRWCTKYDSIQVRRSSEWCGVAKKGVAQLSQGVVQLSQGVAQLSQGAKQLRYCKSRALYRYFMVHPQSVRFQNVRFQNIRFQNVRFQNVRFTKRQVYKTSGFKTSGFKTSGFKTFIEIKASKRSVFKFDILIQQNVWELQSLNSYLK